MKVYRVENDEFKGPYSTFEFPDHQNEKTHPGWIEDFTDSILRWHWESDRQLVCGFPSREAYERWFAGKHRLLRRAGFHLRVYDVEKVLHSKSGKQIAFLHPHKKQ